MTNSPNAAEVTFESLAERTLDVLVVGGGIVGAGVARDAAMRGLRVGLVEQRDFASGTSSRSSRLLHGGIRYLAQGRLGLVREASKEKTVLAAIAPHLAEPLAFIFPTRRGTEWARWKLSIGVKLYDLLCGRRNLGRSTSLNVRRTLELLPGLSTDGLTGSVRYFDALTNDARLVLDTLTSAARNGAILCNYVKLIESAPDGDSWRCQLQVEDSDQTVTVHTRCIVNATGPWSDRLPNSKTHLRPTKGVHLVIDRSRLSVPDAVVMAEGSRILFAIPWGERVILGTTDTDYSGPLEEPTCDAADTAYVLEVTNAAFPTAKIESRDIISTWAGLRPLVADRRGNPSDISRRHEIVMSSPGWWDVTGGKLTTYRLMAVETVDQIARWLDRRLPACATAREPLVEPTQPPAPSGVLPPEASADAVRRFVREEWARRLDDVMIRRTSWRHYRRDQLNIAREVAAWMAAELSWTNSQREAELARYHALCQSSSAPI